MFFQHNISIMVKVSYSGEGEESISPNVQDLLLDYNSN